MRRTTTLTAAGLLGLALLSPMGTTAATSAIAAGATCRGEAATIVGNGKDIVGTQGRDVIVTNRSQDVEALGGDDLICITGPDLPRGASRPVQIDSGAGNDFVDGTAARDWPAEASLGAGSDRFEGGDGDDTVAGGAYSLDAQGYVDTERDVLLTGAGHDGVHSGQAGLLNQDLVGAGQGDDHLSYVGVQAPGSILHGGSGSDSTVLFLAAGDNTIDNTSGELRHGGVVVERWDSLEGFYLRDPEAAGASVTITGGEADEWFSLSGEGKILADLGGGDDSLTVPRVLSADSRVAGGSGRDELALGADTHEIAWDLSGDVLWVGDDWSVPATGFEDAFIVALAVTLWGTDGPNSLAVVSCNGLLKGRDGNDNLYLASDYVFEQFTACADQTRMLGGAGDDRLGSRAGAEDRMFGGPGNDSIDARGGKDRLFGGPGRDTVKAGPDNDLAVGGRGRDRVDGEQGRKDVCRAERELNCERN